MGGSVSTPLPVLGWLRVIGVVVRRRLVSAVCRRGWWHVGWAVRRVADINVVISLITGKAALQRLRPSYTLG
jgi:hypothetical protein